MTNSELHTEEQKEFSKLWKTSQLLIATCAVLVVTVVSLVIGLIAERSATEAKARTQAACQLYKGFANSPATDKTTPLGFAIIAGGRNAYQRAGCNLGPLDPIDPRVAAWMKDNP